MTLVFALLVAVLAFAGLIGTALWMRVADRKNCRHRVEDLTNRRLQLFRELAPRWPGKDWPQIDTSEPLQTDIGLSHAFRAIRDELEKAPQLLLDPVMAAAWAQVCKLEDTANKARLSHAAAVKSYNRALDAQPTCTLARYLKLKKAPKPSITE